MCRDCFCFQKPRKKFPNLSENFTSEKNYILIRAAPSDLLKIQDSVKMTESSEMQLNLTKGPAFEEKVKKRKIDRDVDEETPPVKSPDKKKSKKSLQKGHHCLKA